MALIGNATLAVGTGHFYTAPVNTPIPTDLTAIPAAWEEMGHTSLDKVIGFDSSGGDVTTLGTLQNKTLRQTRATTVDTFSIDLQQFDAAALKLYYGANSVVSTDGKLLHVPTNPAPTEAAWLCVFIDGNSQFAIYAPKANIIRADNMSIDDTESLATLPISVTPLQYGSNDWAYAVTPLVPVSGS